MQFEFLNDLIFFALLRSYYMTSTVKELRGISVSVNIGDGAEQGVIIMRTLASNVMHHSSKGIR